MSGKVLSKIVTTGLVFCFDPVNTRSFNNGSTFSVDLSSGTYLTFKNKVYNGGTGDVVTIISPTYNSGSIYFNGVSVLTGDGLYLPTGDTTTNLSTYVSMSVWFKKTSYNYSYVECPATKGFSPGTQPFCFYLLNNSVNARLTTNSINGYSDIGTTYDINRWNNVVLTYDGSSFKIYLNGELKSSLSKTGPIMNTSNPFNIGCQYNGGYFPSSAPSKTSEYFKGYISNVLVYNKALTNDEVLQNYNALKRRFI